MYRSISESVATANEQPFLYLVGAPIEVISY